MTSTDKYPQYLDQPESRRLEFKERLPKGDQLARTAVGFANGAGGKIVLGVKDSPRELIGIDEDRLFDLSLNAEQVNLLKQCEKPSPMTELLHIAGRSDRTKFKKGVVEPLLIEGLLEMTEPDSPNSPTQKYRTTVRGKQLIESKAYEQ